MTEQIPAMTPEHVHDYLTKIGAGWTGEGVAVELGSWFGATAFYLLQGLVFAGYNKPFYCYDRWKANKEEVIKARDAGIEIRKGENLLPFCIKNINQIYHHVVAYRGNITDTLHWNPEQEIEICLFDAPKRNPVFEYAVRQVGPAFIPGKTIWGLLDYHFYQKRFGRKRLIAEVQKRFIENNPDSFEKLIDWQDGCCCAFFRYMGGIDWGKVAIE